MSLTTIFHKEPLRSQEHSCFTKKICVSGKSSLDYKRNVSFKNEGFIGDPTLVLWHHFEEPFVASLLLRV